LIRLFCTRAIFEEGHARFWMYMVCHWFITSKKVKIYVNYYYYFRRAVNELFVLTSPLGMSLYTKPGKLGWNVIVKFFFSGLYRNYGPGNLWSWLWWGVSVSAVCLLFCLFWAVQVFFKHPGLKWEDSEHPWIRRWKLQVRTDIM
jgi:hypothetical protein